MVFPSGPQSDAGAPSGAVRDPNESSQGPQGPILHPQPPDPPALSQPLLHRTPFPRPQPLPLPPSPSHAPSIGRRSTAALPDAPPPLNTSPPAVAPPFPATTHAGVAPVVGVMSEPTPALRLPTSTAFPSDPGPSRHILSVAARVPGPSRGPRQARRPLKPRKEIQRATASAGRRSRGSAPSTGRGSGFSQNEVDSLLDILLEHLPLCRDEWETVLRLHLERYPALERTVDSLKRKFGALHRKRVPTGDPHIPPDVKKAKLVRQRMTERADIGDGELTEDLLEESIPDEASGGRVNPVFWTEEDPDGSERPSAFAEEEGEGNEIAVGQAAVQPIDDGGVGAALTVNARSVSPRPLVRKRSGFHGSSQKSADEDLVALIKVSMLQEQGRRAEEQSQREQDRMEERERREQDRTDERERRAEERRRREEDREEERVRREEERLRREAEARRHEQFMQLMMMSLSQSSKQSQNSHF